MPAPLEPALLQLLEARHPDLAHAIIERAPLTSAEQFGGTSLERLVVRSAGGATTRYVIKRVAPLSDWLARATRDELAREYQVVADGLLAELPEGVASAALAGAPLGDGQTVLLLRDVSELLAPPGDQPFTDAQLELIAHGAARLHSTFADLPAERAARLGLGVPGDWLLLLSPATTRREATNSPPGHFTEMFTPAWERVAELYPDAWRVLEPLQADPTPLVAALDGCVQTLGHADLKAGNFAFDLVREQLILLDWGNAGRWPGALDLAWCLSVNAAKLPHGRADLLERYRAERERLGVLPASREAWERELALGLLGGALLSCALKVPGLDSPDPSARDRERAELEFWTSAALAGGRLL
jgi:hypothetical protein